MSRSNSVCLDVAMRQLVEAANSDNTAESYRSAAAYWSAWFAMRFDVTMELPVSVAAVQQFIADHCERSAATGGAEFVTELPPAIEQALLERGFKRKPGAPSIATVNHRLAFLSKVHQIAKLASPCAYPEIRAAIKLIQSEYAERDRLRSRQSQALTLEPMQQLLDTCDDSLRGKRDRALLMFAWATGGRSRSEVVCAKFENLQAGGAGNFIYVMEKTARDRLGCSAGLSSKPLSGNAAIAMQDWLDASGIETGALFRQITKGGNLGPALSGQSVRNIVKDRVKLAGIEGAFSAHSIRAGFLAEAGSRSMPIADMMEMTGLSEISVLRAYGSSKPAVVRRTQK